MAKIPLPAANPAPSPTPVPALASQRLMSLDALRGFDMFWIIGGEDVLQAIANLSGSTTFQTIAQRNTDHPEWNGFSSTT